MKIFYIHEEKRTFRQAKEEKVNFNEKCKLLDKYKMISAKIYATEDY